MDNNRFELEKEVLRKKLPSNFYRFDDIGTDKACLSAAARTNNDKLYTMKIELKDFPEKPPRVFVTEELMDNDGMALQCCHEMHCYGTEEGRTQLCHYPDGAWTPRVSLYKVYIKCRLWLELYEIYKETGKTIDQLITEINKQDGNN